MCRAALSYRRGAWAFCANVLMGREPFLTAIELNHQASPVLVLQVGFCWFLAKPRILAGSVFFLGLISAYYAIPPCITAKSTQGETLSMCAGVAAGLVQCLAIIGLTSVRWGLNRRTRPQLMDSWHFW